MKSRIREVAITTLPKVPRRISPAVREALEAQLRERIPETLRNAEDDSPYHGKTFTFLSLAEAERFISDHGPKILLAQTPGNRERSSLRFTVTWENGLKLGGFFPLRRDGLGEWRTKGHVLDYVPFREYIEKTIAWSADRPPEAVGIGADDSRLFEVFAKAHRTAVKIRATCEIPTLDAIPDPECRSEFDRWLDSAGKEPRQPDLDIS